MEPSDVTFQLGWAEIGMLAFALAMIYGLGNLKAIFGGSTRPHMTRQEIPRGDSSPEEAVTGDGEGESPAGGESTGDPDESA